MRTWNLPKNEACLALNYIVIGTLAYYLSALSLIEMDCKKIISYILEMGLNSIFI